MVEHGLPADPANNLTDPGFTARVSGSPQRSASTSETSIIMDVLDQCATAFGIERARFTRQLVGGAWTVHTLQHGMVTSHTADQAEIAMAWMVGLSRFPIRVTRPRVAQPDGSGIRPIAISNYLGIPVVCQNHFAGVIELAGSIQGDLERALDRLGETLDRFGYRLTYDPSIRAQQHIDMDVECGLSGGFWNPNRINLTDDEWSVLAVMGAPAPLRDLSGKLSLTSEQLVEVTRSLVARGLITTRASTRPLASASSDSTPLLAGDALDDGGA